jgi:hypothetical protein
MWVAATQLEPGRVLRKAFSVGRYGKLARKMMIGEEEKKIRQNPAAAGSAILQRVFGAIN